MTGPEDKTDNSILWHEKEMQRSSRLPSVVTRPGKRRPGRPLRDVGPVAQSPLRRADPDRNTRLGVTLVAIEKALPPACCVTSGKLLTLSVTLFFL